MPSEFKLHSFVLDLSSISLLNQSIIDVTLCALDFSFVFCFLEVLFYSGYVFLLRSINSTLSGFLKIKLLFFGQRNLYINMIDKEFHTSVIIPVCTPTSEGWTVAGKWIISTEQPPQTTRSGRAEMG